MPSIESVFPVFYTDRERYEQLKRDLGVSPESDPDKPNEEHSAVHPKYRDIIIGTRYADYNDKRDKLYGVMLLTTDVALYDRDRLALEK